MEAEIRTYIAGICTAQNVHLIAVGIHGGGGSRIVRVIVDTDAGITLDHCEQLSREFSDIFFRKNLFGGNYRLEVTSPGLDRPLEADYEFIRNIGRILNIEYVDENALKTVTGTLLSYKNGRLELETPGGLIDISRASLKIAKVKLKW